ncbi:MAG TPA: hypothetical protein VH186_34895 [Chloroflexia bacterium]|nr:hypothetical protein [Chloroflexia bacterium]
MSLKSNLKRLPAIGALLLIILLAACGDTTATGPATTAVSQATATTTVATASATTAPATTVAGLPTVTPGPTSTTAPATAVPATTAAATSAAPQTTNPPATTAAPTGVPATTAPASGPVQVYYFKAGSIWAALPDGSNKRELVKNVVGSARTEKGQLLYFQKVQSGAETVLQFKLLNPGQNGAETVIDNRAFVAVPGGQASKSPSGVYGVDSRAIGVLAVSPDGSQVAYTKANLSGPTFEGLGGKEYPTELWLADLNPNSPSPRRLVANDKDYIAHPVWSTDGNRIAFIRTPGFGTGAGYPTAIWSVFKDGSRLAFLTGPDLGKVNGNSFYANPAYNLRWVGPLALTFQASNQIATPLWLHDLNQKSDFPTLLAMDASRQVAFCPAVRRYFYLRQEPASVQAGGIFSVSVDHPEASAVALDPAAVQLLDCKADLLLYRDSKGQTLVQRVTAEGKSAGEGVKLGSPVNPKAQVTASFSPDKALVAWAPRPEFGTSNPAGSTQRFTLFRVDGVAVAEASLDLDPTDITWLDNRVAIFKGTVSIENQQMQLVSVSSSGVKTVDSGGGELQIVPQASSGL